MTLDIAKFHRTCPIHPEHKPWFVLQGPDGFYTDHNCPFGCSSSSSNAGMIGNASVEIWENEGVKPIVKYEDDLNIFRFPISGGPNPDNPAMPYSYAYDRPQALALIAPLRIPWHPDKGQDFNSTFTYLGFLWDISNKSVTLHDHKRDKFLSRVNNFIASFSGGRCQMLDVMKIHGSLCHIAYIYPDGRNRLPSLSNFICTFQGNNFTLRYPPKSLISDLIWWKTTLSRTHVTRTLTPRGNPIDLHISVDASTSWGIGISFGTQWDAWQTSPSWKGPSRDIGWLEGVALELVIYVLEEKGFRDSHILVHSDNQGVIGAFDKGRSRNFEVNLSIRRSASVLAACNLSLCLNYIESEENPADPISRGIMGPATDRLFSTFALPKELKPYLLHV
jgi:hypothetical protein